MDTLDYLIEYTTIFAFRFCRRVLFLAVNNGKSFRALYRLAMLLLSSHSSESHSQVTLFRCFTNMFVQLRSTTPVACALRLISPSMPMLFS